MELSELEALPGRRLARENHDADRPSPEETSTEYHSYLLSLEL
jgi:hypothetical protein